MLVARRWRARFTELMKTRGQTDARWSALYMLSASPEGVIQSELAERVGVQGPTLVKLLDALEAQGLVRRQAAASDRRANIIVLEPAGRAVLLGIEQLASDLRDELFDGISDAELAVARRVLDTLSARLRAPETVHASRPVGIADCA